MCFVISIFYSLSQNTIMPFHFVGKQNKKLRWRTWISSKKSINIHHDCMSGSSSFIIWLLKVLMFGNSGGILALLLCLSWLYH